MSSYCHNEADDLCSSNANRHVLVVYSMTSLPFDAQSEGDYCSTKKSRQLI